MIVTQSCSVCGGSPNNERYVEVIVVELLSQILSHHGNARRGAMTRELVLPISGTPGIAARRCDIDRRCFLPRARLPAYTLDDLRIDDEQLSAFQGWMARYYVRIAVPTELVERLSACGFLKNMGKALEKRVVDRGARVHQEIDRIYIHWEPNRELPTTDTYTVSFIIVCSEEASVEQVEERILAIPNFEDGKMSVGGVEIKETKVVWIGNLTLLATRGFYRFGT